MKQIKKWEKVFSGWYLIYIFIMLAYLQFCIAFTTWHFKLHDYYPNIFTAFIGMAVPLLGHILRSILPFKNRSAIVLFGLGSTVLGLLVLRFILFGWQ